MTWQYCVVHPDTEIGDGSSIGDYVEIREGVKIGERCFIDSRVTFTGNATVGQRTIIRNAVIVARGSRIGDDCFICPQVMFENLTHEGESRGGAQIGNKVFVGTNATLASGITIGDGAVIGAAANVRKDVGPGEVWVGNPARRLR